MSNAYKFSKTARDTKPNTEITQLLEKAQDGAKLTREEKDEIAKILYGTFGAQYSTYKLLGWAWNMDPYLKRILVSFTYEPNKFIAYYAPDKTSLRKVLSPVSELIEAPHHV
jgi:hypothetical protein